MNLETQLKLAMETGKVKLGSNSAIKLLKLGKAKLLIIANNCPENIRKDIEYYASLTETPIYKFKGNNKELASLCKKPFPVSVLTIEDPGESRILEVVGRNSEKCLH